MNVRAAAARVLYHVVDQGQSLSQQLPLAQKQIAPRDAALLQEMCYGTLRWLPRLEHIVQTLMDKPLKGKQRVFHHLLLVGLYQISYMRIPAHAAVAETVNATKPLKRPQLRGLINAILRNYQRDKDALDQASQAHEAGLYCHPSWLLKRLQAAYPSNWQDIVAANHQKAPMWLRVNRQYHSRESYHAELQQAGIGASTHPDAMDALKLDAPCDVSRLPGFDQGWVSVQDAAAQLAVDYLQPASAEHILDCCAAPGGKTCHILEHQPDAIVTAIDADENRLSRIKDNLSRLGLNAEVKHADARKPSAWHQGPTFDRILLDAPCSATGVIRRHPDIKWLRRDSDIHALVTLQAEILDAMWQQLAPGGTLVYATCSVLPDENREQIRAFLAREPSAILRTGTQTQPGRQILPGEDDMDGFYYACLEKPLCD
ncbi:16S rRNA (cytosine(967)-C(5))-methyltransferase [Salinivibrio sp. ML323]|uniref:16S rRNA (cytosine(967)-C(5))-methyltransferase RsmB n=1 Tax=Salinivibrio sp. ML323 TaxID=1909474 RepID=UPI000986ADA2|nr:16S rRNA (cytosine(967)-C(5))-methyltransferase RsmB [Salinivibrio sp. ML323]OOE57197.1 16S rRNA (cytosine(967)-C(5))-methyltransferase [Salinivibrio sp. ML323]